MASLVPTLASLVDQADLLLAEGRLPQARRAWEELVQRAQDKVDRATETVARAMLARCLLRLKEPDGAREELTRAARVADPAHAEAYGRYRGALARLAVDDGPAEVARTELLHYLRWAEDERRGAEVLDACLLLSASSEPTDRVEWLERGIAQATDASPPSAGGSAARRAEDPDRSNAPRSPWGSPELGRAWTELGAALDQTGRAERALQAYEQALRWYGQHGRPRDQVAAGWAVGALACRLEEWPLARTTLEAAVGTAEARTDCDDLAALALADLAGVYEAAGDVIEARRLMLRALARAREQQLSQLWPERWVGMVEHARRLELV